MKKTKRIGIIGCGWLGLPLAEHLLGLGYSVSGTTQSLEKCELLAQKGIEAHQLQQADFKEPQPWLITCDYIVLNVPPSQFREEYAAHLVALLQNCPSDTKVIFTSSTSVYADNNTEVDENTPIEGGGRNGVWVVEAEKALCELLGERLTIVRLAGLVGQQRHPVKFMSGKTYPGADAPINLVHLDDCIKIITTLLESNKWGEIYNACTPDHPTKKMYYTFAAEQFDVPPPIFTNESVAFKTVSSQKLIEELNYTFMYSSPFVFP